MKIFGREPTLVLQSISALLSVLVAFGLFVWITNFRGQTRFEPILITIEDAPVVTSQASSTSRKLLCSEYWVP